MSMNIEGVINMLSLRKIRRQRKLTQKELAALAQVSQSTIHYIERGKKSPTLYTLERLAEALGVEMRELLS